MHIAEIDFFCLLNLKSEDETSYIRPIFHFLELMLIAIKDISNKTLSFLLHALTTIFFDGLFF